MICCSRLLLFAICLVIYLHLLQYFDLTLAINFQFLLLSFSLSAIFCHFLPFSQLLSHSFVFGSIMHSSTIRYHADPIVYSSSPLSFLFYDLFPFNSFNLFIAFFVVTASAAIITPHYLIWRSARPSNFLDCTLPPLTRTHPVTSGCKKMPGLGRRPLLLASLFNASILQLMASCSCLWTDSLNDWQ